MFSLDAAVPHLVAALVTSTAALDLYLARGRPRIAGVDYSHVVDPIGLNARAARRLATLPVIALVNAGLAAFGLVSQSWLWAGFVVALPLVIAGVAAEVRCTSQSKQ